MIPVLLLASAVWQGSAQVDVMIWEPSGEHPYQTTFDLTYEEVEAEPLLDSASRVAPRSIRLVPTRIAIDVRHEVRQADGGPICEGGGRELLSAAPEGRIVAGAYQLVLPRAVGAFACGARRNDRDRRVVIGTGLLHVPGEIDAADRAPRTLDLNGSHMQGAYESSDASTGGVVRHDYKVRWELRRYVR